MSKIKFNVSSDEVCRTCLTEYNQSELKSIAQLEHNSETFINILLACASLQVTYIFLSILFSYLQFKKLSVFVNGKPNYSFFSKGVRKFFLLTDFT